jgi:hypothetical protein
LGPSAAPTPSAPPLSSRAPAAIAPHHPHPPNYNSRGSGSG